MKKIVSLAAVAAFSFAGAAFAAEPMNGSTNGNMKAPAPGTTGAMSNANKDGIATDPQGVAEQQKGNGSVKHSAGTVGAAPGADTPSQKPEQNKMK